MTASSDTEPPGADAADVSGTWAGTTARQRADERRVRLLDAARGLLEGADTDVTVRAVLRSSGLNPRYFYESFAGLDELLGALYDDEMADLAHRVEADLSAAPADAGPAVVIRTGIESVLRHLTERPQRGRVLISGWPGNATLVRKRRAGFLGQIQSYRTDPRLLGDHDVDADRLAVFGTMFAGSMGALAEAWADGRLGDDLDVVVDRSVELALALFRAATGEALH